MFLFAAGSLYHSMSYLLYTHTTTVQQWYGVDALRAKPRARIHTVTTVNEVKERQGTAIYLKLGLIIYYVRSQSSLHYMTKIPIKSSQYITKQNIEAKSK